MSTCKIYISYFVNFFMTLCICIALLISLYYLSPDNYTLYEQKLKKSNIIKKIIVKKNSNYEIDYNIIANKKFGFDTDIMLVFKNSFKSQNLCYKKNQVISSNFRSSVLLSNNSDSDLEIKLLIG